MPARPRMYILPLDLPEPPPRPVETAPAHDLMVARQISEFKALLADLRAARPKLPFAWLLEQGEKVISELLDGVGNAELYRRFVQQTGSTLSHCTFARAVAEFRRFNELPPARRRSRPSDPSSE